MWRKLPEAELNFDGMPNVRVVSERPLVELNFDAYAPNIVAEARIHPSDEGAEENRKI